MTAHPGEVIEITPGVAIEILEARGNKVRLAIRAPKSMSIFRFPAHSACVTASSDLTIDTEEEAP